VIKVDADQAAYIPDYAKLLIGEIARMITQ
jgi:hypothetical protein